ncbi:serine/threonine kinase [Aureococcus anophagefferens]|nr:serine/threonine kinase [Aureococcus anophagefferens]
MPSSASRENFLSATTEELEKLTGAEAGTSGAASSSAVAAHPGRSPLALPTALFYGATSIGIIACNKITLTTTLLPSSSALALAQFAVTCACLGALALAGAVELAPPTADSFRVVVPLTALFVADVLMGLFATGSLSLPMFTVLRRFSIPCTMLLERFVGQANPSPLVQASVWGMVGGAVVAAYDDLAFDAKGYAAVLLNDLFTALRGVYVKAALPSVTRAPRSSEKKDVEAQDPAAPRPPPKLSKLSLLFYNALLGGAVLAPYLAYTGELARRASGSRTRRRRTGGHPVAALALSASLGPVLQYAIFVCTQHNSAHDDRAYWWEDDYQTRSAAKKGPHRYASFDASREDPLSAASEADLLAASAGGARVAGDLGIASGRANEGYVRGEVARANATEKRGSWFAGVASPFGRKARDGARRPPDAGRGRPRRRAARRRRRSPPCRRWGRRTSPRRHLGRGRFGEVLLTTHVASGGTFAMKVLHKLLYNSKLRRARNERMINGQLGAHPFVVKMRYAFVTPNPSVLINADGHVTISDFGLSKPGVHDPLKGARSMCGTPEYLAPEILRGTHEHGLAADWWTTGCLLYELLGGQPPWYTSPSKDRDRKKLFERITTAPLKMPRGVKPRLSKDGEHLLRGLLHKDNAVRLGTDLGAAALKTHKFFAMVDFDALLAKQVEPPFSPRTLVSGDDVGPDEAVAWDDIQPEASATVHKMDIPDHRFNEIFAKFEYRPA